VTWWLWTIVALVAIPVISIVVGLGLLVLAFVIPERIMPKGCGCCGRAGYWTHRNSLGAYICDACGSESGAHRHDDAIRL
jgi:hypothetical protein